MIGFGGQRSQIRSKIKNKRILRASQLTRRMLLDSPDFCIGHQSTVNGKIRILDPHLDIAGAVLFRNSSHLQLDLVPKGNSLSFHVTLFLYCGEKGIWKLRIFRWIALCQSIRPFRSSGGFCASRITKWWISHNLIVRFPCGFPSGFIWSKTH